MKIFSRFVFVAVMGVFSLCAARAYETCNPGQYLSCDPDPWNGACTDCGCANCPTGQTSDGMGVVYNCPGVPSGDSGCDDAGYCADYTDECPAGVPNAQYRKCKQVTIECGGVDGCSGYELCKTTNGASAGYFIPYDSNVCHMEGSTCYANTVPCSSFDISVDFGAWTCAKNNQSGSARWDTNANNGMGAWNVSACRCNHTGVIWYKNCNGKYVLRPRYGSVPSVDGAIEYGEYGAEPWQYYCSACSGGFVPGTIYPEDESYKCYNMDNTGTRYVVCDCVKVSTPNYAPGCSIGYPLSSGDVPGECRMQCATGMETIADGATSAADCVPTGETTYTDSTGTFYLGSNPCS